MSKQIFFLNYVCTHLRRPTLLWREASIWIEEFQINAANYIFKICTRSHLLIHSLSGLVVDGVYV